MTKNCLDFITLKNKLVKYKFWIISFIILLIFSTVVGVILIPRAFAQPVKNVDIISDSASFTDKEPGAWKVDKSAKWTSKGEAEITFDVDTIMKSNNKYTDVLFVLDVSGSMDGDKLNRVKADSIELIESLLSNGENKAGLITFDSTSNIVLDFTKDEESLKENINSLTTTGCTNYYQALVNVDEVLKNYKKEKDRECIVLFLTDGYPNEDTPNEETQYSYLRQQYPFITINGIQYEMGSNILDPVKKVSDNQFIADMDTLNNVLFDASVTPITYDEFSITDYIDTNYFYIESENDIKVTHGNVTFDKDAQTVNWMMDKLKSGQGAKMTIKAKLKEEFIGAGGEYPTNTKEEIRSKIENQTEEEKSTQTPILSDKYKVIYDGNDPAGCKVENVPAATNKSVFDIVEIGDTKPTCKGYDFKGWKVVTENVTKAKGDYFIMPESDVVLKATWGRVSVEKSMDGTVSEVQTFYKMMKSQSSPDDEESEFVNSSTGINFEHSSSDTNGKGVYQLAASKNEKYPILYYRGAVENNNVNFGSFCWKIVRTTETGGVKLIYNGKATKNGYCTNTTGTTTQIGQSEFNNYHYSPADVGYMYGNRSEYTYQFEYIPSWYDYLGRNEERDFILESSCMSTNTSYYYGDIITWNEEINRYVLSNVDGSEVISSPWSEIKDSAKGKYTCLNTTGSTCSTVYYVTSTSSNYLYAIKISNNQTLEDVNTTYTYGKEIVYENGVYTIQNPNIGKKSNWYTEYNNYKENYICSDGSASCSTIWYVESTYDDSMHYVEMTNGETYDSLYLEALNKKWIYGNDVEWDGSKYILKDTYESSPINWNNDYKTIATKYHYTCFGTENSCTEVGYIHYFKSDSYMIYYLLLKEGKNIEDAKNEMFANTTDSTIKQTIDKWYQENMLDYTNKLEDTVWCNDRSIYSGPLKSKDEDSSISDLGYRKNTNRTYFGSSGRNTRTYIMPSIECPREEDKFTVNSENGNGMLTYPVALLTADEIVLAGQSFIYGTDETYLYTNLGWWTLSPAYFESSAATVVSLNFFTNVLGSDDSYNKYTRPAISLAPNSIIASGDGTATNPFTVDMDY